MATSLKQSILAGATLLSAPLIAQAHPSHDDGGLVQGFTHPLFGWDHLLVMLAVGVWAARQGGRAMWRLPLVFVGVMTIGGLLGAAGVHVPGVEFIILLSVPVFGWMILERKTWSPAATTALAGFFAFFHGLAHGNEMPVSASVGSFAFGFIAATLLLHGVGIVLVRATIVLLASMAASKALAQSETNSPAPGDEGIAPTRLPTITVTGRADNLVGIAESATQGTVGAPQLARRPTLRPGELLETVPGVIITQHSGAGKANQYFLRGFNLDHGTDFATSLEGMPINMPTHAHGQGYTDLNFLIPELVTGINYLKGPYYAQVGDFSSAGAANMTYARTLPQSFVKLEGGSWDYGRIALGTSPKVGDGNLLVGLEIFHEDGPWENPDDFWRENGVLRYSMGDEANGWSLMGLAYHGDWNATDQIPERAVNSGQLDRFGSLNTTTGGESQKYSLLGEWHRQDENSFTRFSAYGFYYDLDLFSDFTYYLNSPQGDQFEQQDVRYTGGGAVEHTLFGELASRETDTTFGLQVRSDSIRNGLYSNVDRRRTDKVDYSGNPIPATTRADAVWQISASPYAKNETRWTDKFRTTAGLRGDFYHFDVDSNQALNSGRENDFLASPKLGMVFGPWSKTEFYLNAGLGFHSNDGRGTTTHVDPVTGLPVDSDGNPIQPVDPLVRSYGAEGGVRTAIIPGLQSTLSVWWLDLDSELLYVGDAGATEASRPSRRYGIEFANYYTPTEWLTLDADLAFSHTRFRDDQPEGNYIPGSVASVIAAGLTVQDAYGFFGELRVRYFGPRPLTEDDSVRSTASTLLNGRIGYRFNKHMTVAVEVFNILNAEVSDIEYYYASRLATEAAGPDDGGYNDIHFHPAEPRSLRVIFTAQF